MAARRMITQHETIRRRLGYSVTSLAKAVGYSHSYVSQVEGCHRTPSARYREAVSQVLRVPEILVFSDE